MRIALLIALAAFGAPSAPAADAPRASAEVGGRVLDLAFTRHDRLVVLMDGSLALFRVGRDSLERLDERPLPTPGTTRLPAGILAAEPGGDTVWVATNRAEGATLYSTESDRLWEVERAAALPWPGVARGLTFRPGTNLIEGEMTTVGAGPVVCVGEGWAIDNDGTLLAEELRAPEHVGSAAVRLDARRFLVTGSDAPADRDRLEVLSVKDDGTTARTDAGEVRGAVTALAADRRDAGVVVAAGALAAGRASIVLVGSLPDARR